MIHLRHIRQTCSACPAQWEGTAKDGRKVYARYRFGRLSVSVSPEPTDDIYDAVGGEEVLSLHYGGEWDGCMDDEQMFDLASGVLAPPQSGQEGR